MKLIAVTLIEVVEKSAPSAVKYILRKCEEGYRAPLLQLAVIGARYILITLKFIITLRRPDGTKSWKAQSGLQGTNVQPAELITLQPRPVLQVRIMTSNPCQMFALAARSVFVNSGRALREIVISRLMLPGELQKPTFCPKKFCDNSFSDE